MALTGRRPLRWWPTLTLIVVAGAALRFTVYLVKLRHRPFGFNDADYYSQQAVQLAHGHWFTDPLTGKAVAEHAPLPSVILVPFSFVAQPHEWQRFATVLVGVAVVVLIALAARELAGPRVGLIAGAIAAIYPNLWINDGLVMSESLTAAVVAAWILCALRLIHSPTGGRALAAGAVVGAAALTRSELVLLLPVTAGLAWRGVSPHWRRAALAVAAGAIVMAPWVVPNLFRFERPVTLSTNDGTTWRGANCDRTYGGAEMGSWSVFCLVIEPDTVALEPSIRSDRWRADAFTYARQHAARVPLVVAARVGRTLDVYGLGYQVSEDVRDGRPRSASWLAIVSFWLLAPLAAWQLLRLRGATAWVLGAPVGIVAITTVVFYGGHRIRTPMEPVVVISAAMALDALARRRARIAA